MDSSTFASFSTAASCVSRIFCTTAAGALLTKPSFASFAAAEAISFSHFAFSRPRRSSSLVAVDQFHHRNERAGSVRDDLHHAGRLALVFLRERHLARKRELGEIALTRAERCGVGRLKNHRRLLGRMHAHVVADGAHRFDEIHDLLERSLLGGEVQRLVVDRPGLDHDALFRAGRAV